MEFGFEPVCDQLRSSRFELSRHVEIARKPAGSWSQTGYKAKFHYAILFETARRQVLSWLRTCRRPASSCWFAASKLDDRPNFSSLQACDQLRTSFEPDSVMVLGLKHDIDIFSNQQSSLFTLRSTSLGTALMVRLG